MKIGICNGNLSLYETLISLGYDFVEVNNTYIHGLSEDEFASLKAFADAHPGFIYSCNCLIPGDLRLTGPDVDFEKIRKFCLESFSRMNDLGVKMLVFGSSKAKTVPEGFPMEKAWQQGGGHPPLCRNRRQLQYEGLYRAAPLRRVQHHQYRL